MVTLTIRYRVVAVTAIVCLYLSPLHIISSIYLSLEYLSSVYYSVLKELSTLKALSMLKVLSMLRALRMPDVRH